MPNYGGAAADLQICLSFLAAEAKGEAEQVTQFTALQKEKHARALVKPIFQTACYKKVLVYVVPGDVIPLTRHRYSFLMSSRNFISEAYSPECVLTSPH